MGASGLMYFLGLPGQVTVGPTLTVSSVHGRPSPGPWPLNKHICLNLQSVLGMVAGGQWPGAEEEAALWGTHCGSEGERKDPQKGQAEIWCGASRPDGVPEKETYPACGQDTAGPVAHPGVHCCQLRGPGLHPQPGASVWGSLSLQDRTVGAPGGRGGNACMPSSSDRLLPWETCFVWKNPGRQVRAALSAPGGARLAQAWGPPSTGVHLGPA